ncbi:hypothetical protein [Pedococcus soli]
MTDQHGGGRGASTAYGVSDEVWRDLEVEAERASVRERPALVRAAAVVAVLAVGTTALLLSGLVSARLSGVNGAGGGSDSDGRSFMEFTLHNDGVTPVHVVRWTSLVKGVQVEKVDPKDIRLSPRGQQKVRLSFVATDCRAAVPSARKALAKSPNTGGGVGVVVDRPWGQMETVVYPVMSMEDMVLSSCGQGLP